MTKKDDFDLMLFLPYLLNQAAEECSVSFQQHYKDKYNMLRTEWRVLFHLGYYGDMTAREICNRSKLHKTKVSRAVASLQKRRFLTREKLPHDRRSEVLKLSPAGVAAYRDLRESALSYDQDVTKDFSKPEVDALRQALLKLARL
ncbi:MAG: helix-turn-helix domain-containing protein [Paracoccaceae bacterium]|jgi:DNA-binding MarR family transcriptional regulator|nr:helix-turn-helix domain-containing protein [Paracoccaceae bacterium]